MLKNRLAARSFARACSNAFRPTLTVPPRKKPTKEQMAFKNREQTIAATNAPRNPLPAAIAPPLAKTPGAYASKAYHHSNKRHG